MPERSGGKSEETKGEGGKSIKSLQELIFYLAKQHNN